LGYELYSLGYFSWVGARAADFYRLKVLIGRWYLGREEVKRYLEDNRTRAPGECIVHGAVKLGREFRGYGGGNNSLTKWAKDVELGVVDRIRQFL
tara:strand:- start:28 stop:312 length:285 start_codon:yes stop_codon:yes gene_type:complete